MRYLLSSLLLLALALPASATVQATATARVNMTPDTAVLTVQVQVRGLDAADVTAKDRAETEALSQNLTAAGIDPARYLVLAPPVQAGVAYSLMPTAGMVPTTTEQITLWTSTRKATLSCPLSLLPRVLTAIVNPARTVLTTAYQRQDVTSALKDARAVALADAQAQCQAAAQALGVTLTGATAAVFSQAADNSTVTCTLIFGQK